MSTEITKPAEEVVATTSLALNQADMAATGFDEGDYAGYATGGDFLPRLQLSGASSDLCKTGKAPIGTYSLVHDKDKSDNLDKQVNLFVLSIRLKALELLPTGPISFFDAKSEEFKRVAAMSEIKDSNCMAGPEFLVYIPAVKAFATFFMASKSMRNEAPTVKALLGKAATLTVALAENKKKQKWHVTKTLPCSIPLSPPDNAALQTQLLKFRNPVSATVKAVPPSATSAPTEGLRG